MEDQVKKKGKKVWIYVSFFIGIGSIFGGVVYFYLQLSP